MGQYQRDWVEVAEKAVASGLNREPQNAHIAAVVNAIKVKIPQSYSLAQWAGGNDYANPGDVHVYYPNSDVVKIELKFSHGQGQGTAKNVTERYFTKNIDAGIKSYKLFDQELGLQAQRWQLVEQASGTVIGRASAYTKLLRQYRLTQPTLLDQIADITAPGQEQYATYAAVELNKHIDQVNVAIRKLLNTDLVDQNRQDVLYCVVKHFGQRKQTVEFYDFTDMDQQVVKVSAIGKSIKFENQSGKDVVRFSVTWKNICQGGSTPCFNVFVGNAFKGK